jgi:hypothetical protein
MEKTTNYTPEQTAEAVSSYQAGVAVEQIAIMLGKSVRSVVAKLSREGVYVAKTKAAGAARVTKADLVGAIASKAGVPVAVVASLEKATAEALEAVFAAL